jgi:hypothetical protein
MSLLAGIVALDTIGQMIQIDVNSFIDDGYLVALQIS